MRRRGGTAADAGSLRARSRRTMADGTACLPALDTGRAVCQQAQKSPARRSKGSGGRGNPREAVSPRFWRTVSRHSLRACRVVRAEARAPIAMADGCAYAARTSSPRLAYGGPIRGVAGVRSRPLRWVPALASSKESY